ncbi:uncharacterized protein [Ptychodera flava]|uniref:uncharacterized protein n=1 Tax=Ptychodera flava TaxID=63121 RepID=UPI00396A3837
MESKQKDIIKALEERLLKSIEEATVHQTLTEHKQALQKLLNEIKCLLPLNTKEQVSDEELSDRCPERMVAVEKLLHECTEEIKGYTCLKKRLHETIGKSKSVNHLYLNQLEDIEREFDHILTTLKSLTAKCQESITTSKEILECLQLQKMIKCSESLLVAADKVLVNLGQLSSVDDEIESAKSAIQTCGQDTKEVQMAIEDVRDIIERLSQAKKDANDSEGSVRENKEKLSATLGIAKPNVGDIAETKDTLARNLEMLEQLCGGMQKKP